MSTLAYIVFVIVALLAWAVGAVGAYFYHRARHRETVSALEARDQDLAEREEELRRLQYQLTTTHSGGLPNPQPETQVEWERLKEELEQKKNDYNILRQDFDLELGILKQELEQLRSEKSNVENARRHLSRKDADLEERERELQKKEQDVAERSQNLAADKAEREKRLEDDFAARAKRAEKELLERTREVHALKVSAQEKLKELEQRRASLKKKQAQLDDDFLELPIDKFTSRQEATLIKRLRQQIKLQRDELEHLQQLRHKSTVEATEAAYGSQDDDVSTEKRGPEARSGDSRSAAAARIEGVGVEQGDSFPAFTTLSSHVDRGGAAAPKAERPSIKASDDSPPEQRDDLTSLPGIDSKLQSALSQLEITSFDQIARWSSADVRRVSEKLEIDRKTIQDHWIISAQSRLFPRRID